MTAKTDMKLLQAPDSESAIVVELEAHIEILKGNLAEYMDLLGDTLDKLKAERAIVGQVEKLLHYTKCPDPNCDGKGTVCDGKYQHENGEIEYNLHQCQWCDEKDQFECTIHPAQEPK